jgi:hypothetical protein
VKASLSILAVLVLAAAAARVPGSRRFVRGTTLTTAWAWAAAGTAVWLMLAGWECVPHVAVSRGVLDRAWFAAALVFMCAQTAVLGARRPGVRVWNAFVLAPLFIVLVWPALAVGSTAALQNPLELDTPAALAVGFVLLMGNGNFWRTRFTLPAVMLAAAVAAIVVPLCGIARDWPLEHWQFRVTGAVLLAAAIVLAHRSAERRPITHDAVERVWFDFRDWFGVVWALRIMDRVNQTAVAENWPVRLTFDGFRWNDPAPDTADAQRTRERIEHTLRWLLRRFVDAEWLDERLGMESRVE